MGASLGVVRAFLTAGVSTTLVEEGVDPVPDEVFRGSGDRNLFASLDRHREWGFFIALSFGVIQ